MYAWHGVSGRAVVGAVLLAVIAGAGSVSAQARTRVVSVVGGPAPYDLAGTGTGVAVGMRGDFRPIPYLSGQIGVSYFAYSSSGVPGGYDYVLPEATVMGRIPIGRVAPYLGAGAGVAFELRGHDDESLTLHGVLGANVALARNLETVTEARIRSIDPWTGNTVDLLVGAGWRF